MLRLAVIPCLLLGACVRGVWAAALVGGLVAAQVAFANPDLRHILGPAEHAFLRGKVVLGSLVFVGGLGFYVYAFNERRPLTLGARAGYALLGGLGVLIGGLFGFHALTCLLG